MPAVRADMGVQADARHHDLSAVPDEEGGDAMTRFNLAELQALAIPRCSSANLKGLPDEYLTAFVAPRHTPERDGLTCVGCGATLYLPGIIGALMGATFTWGVANGEGHCSRCGYPTRMYHRLPEGTGTFPLQYHPDELERRD